MSQKKNKSRNKSSARKSLFREDVEGITKKGKRREDDKKRKSVYGKQTTLHSFTIEQQAGDALHGDISEESFNPPLHSTAVYSDDVDLLEKTKVSIEQPESSGPSVSQEKSVRRKSSAKKNKTAAIDQHSLTRKSVPRKKHKAPQKPATPSPEVSNEGQSSESEEEKAKPRNRQRKTPQKAAAPPESLDEGESSEPEEEILKPRNRQRKTPQKSAEPPESPDEGESSEPEEEISKPRNRQRKTPQKAAAPPESPEEGESSEPEEEISKPRNRQRKTPLKSAPPPEVSEEGESSESKERSKRRKIQTKTSQKPKPATPPPEVSEEGESSEHEEESRSPQQTSHPDQTTNKSSSGNSESKSKGKTPNRKKGNKSKQKELVEFTVWSPTDAPGTARNVNELDILLTESEKVVEHYRESIDGAHKKAVDNFFLSFKDQLTASIKNVRMLKDLKRKNKKVRCEIGRKRKRLIEVRDEILKKQPRLNELQRQCSELNEKQRSIKDAETFLDNLQQLKEDYRKYRARNPDIDKTYGLSSLPALIIQAQSTMRAEKHFHNMNTTLHNIQTKAQ